jgi:cell wall-active antibiotic response 4TMS protein YvqF
MNQYLFLHRIQGPALLLTFGVTALLDQWDIMSFGRSWPLYLIVLGILKLAQRAALMNAEPPAYPGYPATAAGTPPPPAPPSTSLVTTDANTSVSNESGDRR